MFIRDSYAEDDCKGVFGVKSLKKCDKGIPPEEKKEIIAELKKQLSGPVTNENFCIKIGDARYNVRIALLHQDGMYTVNQHDLDLAKEVGTFRSRTLSTPFVESGVARNLVFLDVLCSPGSRGAQTHLVLTRFKPPSPKRPSLGREEIMVLFLFCSLLTLFNV